MQENFTSIFPSALEDVLAAETVVATPQTVSSSYRLAFRDYDLLLKDELRPVRLMLELLKAELVLREHGITETIVIFGSARIATPETAADKLAAAQAALQQAPDNPQYLRNVASARRDVANARYYTEAQQLARFISQANLTTEDGRCVVVTGGGPGIMEAANRGAYESGAPSVGLNIVVPHEQHPNAYVTPELSFLFHYFAIRKMHFLLRARVLVVFPGGFGTFDELFDALTLIQTHKINPLPILIFGKAFWERVLNLHALVDEGMIAPEDVELIQYVETAEEAWDTIAPLLQPDVRLPVP
ncbi:MAG: putative lysine decarboxylase [bacterium ADurb.Bin429]|nr:MAG: putative lysine decarboxylase [bacterium ADurb.Bin429]